VGSGRARRPRVDAWLGANVDAPVYDLRKRKDPDEPDVDWYVATIKRAYGSVAGADPVGVARADVLAMLGRIRTRAKLGPHPHLDPVQLSSSTGFTR
jgi:hypothetical protein